MSSACRRGRRARPRSSTSSPAERFPAPAPRRRRPGACSSRRRSCTTSSLTSGFSSSGPVTPSMWYLPSLPERRPRRPERRGAGQHRPALLGQPRLVAGDEVVLPLGERDVRGDVLLVQALAVDRRRGRDLLGAVERALPREARAARSPWPRRAAGRSVAAGTGTRPCRRRGRGAGAAATGHPRLGIPEDVAVVAIGRQARRDTLQSTPARVLDQR